MSAKSEYPGVGWRCPKCAKQMAARTVAQMQPRARRHQRNCKGAEAKP